MQEKPVLDELMANAWRPVVVETHGGWRYRWAEGVTRRANSALAVGNDGRIEELVARAEVFYAERGAPASIQMSTASAPPALAAYLRARGYRSSARTLVQVADTQDVVERTHPTVLDAEVAATPTEEWFNTYWSVEARRGRTDDDREVYRRTLLRPGLPTAFASARDGSELIGVGQIVTERGWGGIQCMATAPGHRRRGVARAVLHAVAEEALRREVGHLYLAVMADNEAAVALYERAGFRTVHEYSYFGNAQMA